MKECKHCKKEFENPRRRILSYQKENHWNWKGGLTDINKKIRNSVEYNAWRKQIYARDNWTCQHCNIKQRYPVAHHLKTFKEYPELRFVVSNGITLCRACHKKVHMEIGINTRFSRNEYTSRWHRFNLINLWQQ